jgi:hypothetical protein
MQEKGRSIHIAAGGAARLEETCRFKQQQVQAAARQMRLQGSINPFTHCKRRFLCKTDEMAALLSTVVVSCMNFKN